ncbi:hypothetical protein L210DRAFT_3639144 [Boletus edulis BED1]|uniref:Uncharacterized protein n=1 Tax=Boletus edulis BED1 TaxID=1328754 RepID=A0AAD4C9S5_BOLED|nr:hypothetical protein L210DRAFT_3639144 [Boletus edulis BED1]
MYSIVSLVLLLASVVHASVYVTNPVQSSSCSGGQACTVQWVDNGQAPLLSDIGECDVALYYGNYMMVQSLPSVNVATTSSFTFTPNPSAGPNGQYYLVFTNSAINYSSFSGSFALTGLTGTTPGGGSSTTASTSATRTSSGSSTSAGSSTPATTSGSSMTSTPTGTSTPTTTPTTTPTSSTPTSTTDTNTPTLTTPTATTSTPLPTSTTPTTTTTPRTSTSATASATATSAAGRLGSDMSLGGAAALFVLSAVLAF